MKYNQKFKIKTFIAYQNGEGGYRALTKKFGLNISVDEVSSEAVLLYHEEINGDYISSEVLVKLPDNTLAWQQ